MHSPIESMRNWKNHVNATGLSCIPIGTFYRVMKHLERNKTASGDVIAANDYIETGLRKPTGSQPRKQFGARARAGKQGGESELHATLIKAATKKVFVQPGPDGNSRKVAYTGHVVEELRQLVNASR